MDVKSMSRTHKLLEGWQAGGIVVVVAFLCVLVAVPRPVLPDEIPFPRVDQRALLRISEKDADRARALAGERPGYDVRALGEAVRQYGAADADSDSDRGTSRYGQMSRAVAPALEQGVEPVLALRAYQMTVFLRELETFANSGVETTELRELGGGIVALLRRSQWIRPAGKGYRLLPDRFVLEVLFKKRWNEITGLKGAAFALSLEEQRALYAFLLANPLVLGTVAPGLPWRCRAANEYLLRKVGELSEIDPEYPVDVARGILFLRLGRHKDAVDTLAGYLDSHPDGPLTLRTRNTLREAQERLSLTVDR
jgi:hypothetical protein